MPIRPRQRLQYMVERLLVRGAHYRLLFIAALVGLVSVVAGAMVLEVDGDFSGWPEASWWAFLRLTDPGYLGDDEGIAKRVIATIVTVIGYVLFMGSLVAIMTQWLTQTLRNLERGFTPVSHKDHVLVLGWTNRTPSLLRELLQSRGRARRFLRSVGARRLVIVVLTEDVSAELVQTLKDSLGSLWDSRAVILRSGSALHVDHLERVAFAQAAAVIIPGVDFAHGGPEHSDTRIIKTILTISHYGRRQNVDKLPLLVGEIFDDRKLHVARRAYSGQIEVLSSYRFVSRLMAQIVRHAGVFRVFDELLVRDDGCEVYIRPCKEFVGKSFAELVEAYPKAVLLGFVGPSGGSFTPMLNPGDAYIVDEDTRAVLIAETFEDTQSDTGHHAPPLPRGKCEPLAAVADARPRRILLLGWNHKAPVFLKELSSYANERFEVHGLSILPAAEREGDISRHSMDDRVELTLHTGDYAVRDDLAALQPETFDNIVVVASDHLNGGEESDARSATGYLVLTDLLTDVSNPPRVLVEVLEPENARLLGSGCERLVSPLVLSHMLAQVALRRELRPVFDELFGPGGAEIVAHPAELYIEGDSAITFQVIRRRAFLRGEVALGVSTSEEVVHVNPPKDQQWQPGELREVLVLLTS